MTSFQREFAGELRSFQLPPANPQRLYRGIEGDGVGNISDLAARVRTLGALQVERVLVHALSRGHPLTMLRMQELVRGEMRDKPFTEFVGLAVDIITAAYAGDAEAA